MIISRNRYFRDNYILGNVTKKYETIRFADEKNEMNVKQWKTGW